jgi:hypothetical protein
MAKRKIKKTKSTKLDNENIKLPPIVKSLYGVIKLPADFDYKKEYGKHLWEKYGEGLERKS